MALPFFGKKPAPAGTSAPRPRVGADRAVVLVPAADAETDGQPPAAEHVAGGKRFREHHRIVQLRDDHRGDQAHPIGPGGQGTEEGQ